MKQEPVAWIYRHKKNKIQDLTTYQRTFDSEVIEEIPLYTEPKQLSNEIETLKQLCDSYALASKIPDKWSDDIGTVAYLTGFSDGKKAQLKQLSDEEIDEISDEVVPHIDTYAGRREFARAILKKASEK